MSNEERPVLYINVIVHDASEVVKAKVDESFGDKKVTAPLKSIIMKLASDLATPTNAAEKLSPKLCEKLPTKLKEKGITVEVEQVFLEGPYIVLQLQVQHVDSVKVVKNSKSGFGFLESLFYIVPNKAKLEKEYLPDVVQQKMESVMGEVLAGKLSEKKLETTTVVLHETKQARYFFDTLKLIRIAEQEAAKRKRRSSQLMSKASSSNTGSNISNSNNNKTETTKPPAPPADDDLSFSSAKKQKKSRKFGFLAGRKNTQEQNKGVS